MDGVINIYKEKGFTSHDVVAVVRRILEQKKVGHTGTLDPNAEGVLPVCVGKATKIADYIMGCSKTYEAEITFGAETVTQDAWGEITKKYDFNFDAESINNTVYSFKGEYTQIPPMYSAIKVNGKKLYEIARKGQEIERKARQVEIYNIDIINFLPPNKITILVECSKGTYIRTLAADIGKKLNNGAYMSALKRVKSGMFDIQNSIKLSDLKSLYEANNVDTVLITIENALKDYKKVYINKKADKLLHNGGSIYAHFFDKKSDNINIGDNVIAFDSNLVLNGIYIAKCDNKGCFIKPLTILL